MKKAISLLLIFGLMFSVTSCVTQQQYDELEQRVAALENERSNSNSENTIDSSSNDASATSDAMPSNTEESIPDEVSRIVSLDGMSANEIADLILSYTATPIEGSTDEDYMTRFPEAYRSESISPNYTYGSIYFPSGTYLSTVYAESYVQSVDWHYVYNMDGTIHVPYDDYSYSMVSVFISDYDTATEVYNILSAHVYDNHSNIQEITNDSSWGLSDSQYYWYTPTILGMSLVDGGYRLAYINYY